jgi:hypothetical protein
VTDQNDTSREFDVRYKGDQPTHDQLHDPEAEVREVLSLIYVMLTGTLEPWDAMSYDERCARAANEAQQAFLRFEARGNDGRA